MFLRVITVHVHLPDIRMIQLGQFEIDDYETAQSSMEEEQIYTKPTVSDAQSPLPPYEREVAAQLKQEVLEPVDGRLQGRFPNTRPSSQGTRERKGL